VVADLDRLAAALRDLPADVAETSGVLSKLRSILTIWDDEPSASHDNLESATANEIFALLDHELGR
jgi:hypothetical protein